MCFPFWFPLIPEWHSQNPIVGDWLWAISERVWWDVSREENQGNLLTASRWGVSCLDRLVAVWKKGDRTGTAFLSSLVSENERSSNKPRSTHPVIHDSVGSGWVPCFPRCTTCGPWHVRVWLLTREPTGKTKPQPDDRCPNFKPCVQCGRSQNHGRLDVLTEAHMGFSHNRELPKRRFLG